MLTSDFDYNLPKELIAHSPASPRDSSRLMVIDKQSQEIKHQHFYDIDKFISKGDLLVWNNSKVFKARLRGNVMLAEKNDDISDIKEEKLELTDRILNAPQVEIFLLRPMENKGVWKVMAKPGKKLRLGMRVVFAEDFYCEVLLKEKDGTILVEFVDDDMIVRAKANKYGEVPTPPYINVPAKQPGLVNDYQTVYAKHEGSVAAPTAGFHFTPELIAKLKNKGVEFAEVTLHVGMGTFQPVKTDKIEEHQMHSEWVELTSANADLINKAKKDGRRVIAVGTTTVRTLEGLACLSLRTLTESGCSNPDELEVVLLKSGSRRRFAPRDDKFKKSGSRRSLHSLARTLKPYTGDVNIFITPGFEFKIIDALITNFHLPKSTLLMLVSALAEDREFVLDCYKKAVEAKYRFYSFGDAMLIK